MCINASPVAVNECVIEQEVRTTHRAMQDEQTREIVSSGGLPVSLMSTQHVMFH